MLLEGWGDAAPDDSIDEELQGLVQLVMFGEHVPDPEKVSEKLAEVILKRFKIERRPGATGAN